MVTLSPVIHKGIYQGCQKTNITRSPSYSAHKSKNHKVLFHYNNSASKTIYSDLLRDLMTEPSIDACSLPWGPYFCFCSTPTIHHRLLEQESSSSVFDQWGMIQQRFSSGLFWRRPLWAVLAWAEWGLACWKSARLVIEWLWVWITMVAAEFCSLWSELSVLLFGVILWLNFGSPKKRQNIAWVLCADLSVTQYKW